MNNNSKELSKHENEHQNSISQTNTKEYSNIAMASGNLTANDIIVNGKKKTKIPISGSTVHIHTYDPNSGSSNECQPSSSLDSDLTDFSNLIKDDYKNLALPGIAWLSEGESSIEENYVELSLHTSNNSTQLEDIFNRINQNIPRRILIQGQPGSGKTSLATKIVYDWATEKEYVAENFKLVLFLPLRELQQQTFENAIQNIGERFGFGDKIEAMIKHNEQQTLFVLDGLDEISENDRYPILKLLYKRQYSHACVIVTCRTGLFDLKQEEYSKLFGSVKRMTKFYDVQITVKGIENKKMKKEILRKFIENKKLKDDDIITELETFASNSDFFNTPLFLILFAFIVNTDENITQIFTRKTDLYKKLFNCIIKHSCKRNVVSISQHFSLFDIDLPFDNEDKYKQDIIRQFGHSALENIIENNTLFACNTSTTEIYNLGFFMKHKQILQFSERNNYEAFHLSVLEFAAAFTVWLNCKSKSDDFNQNVVTSIIKYSYKSFSTSQILPFLVGLFEDEVNQLFQQVEVNHLSPQDIYILLNMLQECPSMSTVKAILPCLKSFIPVEIELINISSFDSKTLDLCKEIIQFGTKCGKIQAFWIDDTTPRELMRKIAIPGLKIYHDFYGVNLADGFDTDYSNNLSTHKTISKILSYFPISDIESCQLTMLPKAYGNIHLDADIVGNNVIIIQLSPSLRENCNSNEIFFSYLEYEIKTKLQCEYLVKLLQNNQIKHLNAKVHSDFKAKMADVIRAVSESKCLTSLKVSGATRIDLNDLTTNGSKDFDLLDVDCRLICCHSLSRQIHCRHLSCFNISASALIQIEPINLNCTIETINDVKSKCSLWTGFKSLNHLTISINTNIQRFDALLACTNLQTLHIIVNGNVESKIVAESIKYLSIKELTIDYQCPDFNICKIMYNYWTQEPEIGSNLQIINLMYNRIALLPKGTDTVLEEGIKYLFQSSSIQLMRSHIKDLQEINNDPPSEIMTCFINFFQSTENQYSDIGSMGLALLRFLNSGNVDVSVETMYKFVAEIINLTLTKLRTKDIKASLKTTPEKVVNEIKFPISLEAKALILGLEKNYWSKVNLHCFSEFQMNELEIDLSIFDVVSYRYGVDSFDNGVRVYKTSFSKSNFAIPHTYSITKKIE